MLQAAARKTVISITGKIISKQRGFTYILALIAVAITTITSTTAYLNSRYIAKRALEREIMFEGMAYYNAIRSFYLARTPHRYPARLEDLEQDPRFLNKKHIRKKYNLYGNSNSWNVLRNNNGNIIGVYFDSVKQPLKKTDFPEEFKQFSIASSYRDWKFVFLPNPVKSK